MLAKSLRSPKSPKKMSHKNGYSGENSRKEIRGYEMDTKVSFRSAGFIVCYVSWEKLPRANGGVAEDDVACCLALWQT